MAPSLRDIPGANQPRRRFASSRDVFTASRSRVVDLTPRGMSLDRQKRGVFGGPPDIDVGRWLLTLAVVVIVGWLGVAFWGATRVSADLTGVESGAPLTPADATDLRLELTIPSSDDRFRAAVTLDGVDVLDDLAFDGETLVLQPADLDASGLVDALDEGEHVVHVAVSRLILGDATFRWTYVVDGVAPAIRVPPTHQPVAIDEAVTVTGEVDPDAQLVLEGEPVEHDDGRFSVEFGTPPAGALRFEATDAAGNRTVAETIVPVAYPEGSHAVHVTAAAWGNDELRAGVLDLVDAGLIDTVELDLKDEGGVVGYASELPAAHRVGAVQPEYDLREAVAVLEDRGVRVIGRLVAFRDPIYAQHAWDAGRRDEVLQTPDGDLLGAYGGFANYAHPAVRQYNLDIALEAVDLGVGDILWDYVRRPEGHPSTMVVPGLDGPSSVVVADFLADAHEELRRRGAYQGASVFGIAAQAGDSIAQDVPTLARVVDYLAPMIYPSHWGPGQYRVKSPIHEPYEITKRSLADFQRVATGSGVRFLPWIQDFDLAGVEYGPAEVRAQITAARELGIEGFLLWNAQVRYTSEALDPIS